jgi:hypothetical protein
VADIDGETLRRWLQSPKGDAGSLVGIQLENSTSQVIGKIVSVAPAALLIQDDRGKDRRVPFATLDSWVAYDVDSALAARVDDASRRISDAQAEQLQAGGFQPKGLTQAQYDTVLRALASPGDVTSQDVETIVRVMQQETNGLAAFALLKLITERSRHAGAVHAARNARALLCDLNPLLHRRMRQREAEAAFCRHRKMIWFNQQDSYEERINVAGRILDRAKSPDDVRELALAVRSIFSWLDEDVPERVAEFQLVKPAYDKLLSRIIEKARDWDCMEPWMHADGGSPGD